MGLSDTHSFLPLTPLWFQILMALYQQENHGYGILKEIEDRSGEHFKTATGPVYLALQRLADQRLIAEHASKRKNIDARRRYYRITPLGKRVAVAEAERLMGMVGSAVELKLLDRDSLMQIAKSHGR